VDENFACKEVMASFNLDVVNLDAHIA
jgi:hypothetical protein